MKIEAENRETLSDEEIIKLYWQRNEKAISETDEKYGSYLFTIAFNILNDRLDCEECVNDTYLGTWNRIPPTRPRAFSGFLSRITRNISVDRFRQKRAQHRVPNELIISLDEIGECVACAPSVSEEYAVTELARLINGYLESLKARSEFIFVCRYYYADSIAHIASMLGVGEQTGYRELRKLRTDLQKWLRKGGYYYE